MVQFTLPRSVLLSLLLQHVKSQAFQTRKICLKGPKMSKGAPSQESAPWSSLSLFVYNQQDSRKFGTSCRSFFPSQINGGVLNGFHIQTKQRGERRRKVGCPTVGRIAYRSSVGKCSAFLHSSARRWSAFNKADQQDVSRSAGCQSQQSSGVREMGTNAYAWLSSHIISDGNCSMDGRTTYFVL